jgi:hypothetical protein
MPTEAIRQSIIWLSLSVEEKGVAGKGRIIKVAQEARVEEQVLRITAS